MGFNNKITMKVFIRQCFVFSIITNNWASIYC